MLIVENVEVVGFRPATRGMRNPMNSHNKSDSLFLPKEYCDEEADFELAEACAGVAPIIKENDLGLMQRLYKAGSEHRKYDRMIMAYMDITANHTFWAEFDTYKIGTVRNSCSKMHKIHVKEFVPGDFDSEGIEEVGGKCLEHFHRTIEMLEWLRVMFNETHEKRYWRAIIEMLPMGYRIKATVMMSYETVFNIIKQRTGHKLLEWGQLIEELRKLPYIEEIMNSEK